MSSIENSKRTIPESLSKQQQERREKTKQLVQDAITELRAEGRKVTMKGIMEISGLARATLSKPHIEEVLRINRVCKYEVKNKITDSRPTTLNDLNLEILALKKALNKVTKENQDLKNKNNSLKLELFEQKDRNEKLLGEIQSISTKCRMNNIRLEMITEDGNTTLELIKS